MIRLVHGELTKFRTLGTWRPLAVLCLLLSAALPAATVAFTGQPGTATFPPDTLEGLRNVYGASAAAYPFALAFGILGVAGEYRYMTITSTLLAVPRRGRLVAAKLLTYGLVGLVLGVVCTAVSLLSAVAGLAGLGYRLTLPGLDLAGLVPRTVLVVALYGVLGAGIGALVRNQTVAMTVSVIWLFVVEGVLVTVVPLFDRWLPGGAARAVLQLGVAGADRLLPAWSGALLFTAWAVVFAVVGWWVAVRRDVT